MTDEKNREPGGISPWADSAELKSPDGRHTASISDAGEIAMGAPVSGTLIVDGRAYPDCGVSFVWSDDSSMLAVPQWTRDRMQRLLIIDVVKMSCRYAPGRYRVLQLESFTKGVVSGIDSPIYFPERVKIEAGE